MSGVGFLDGSRLYAVRSYRSATEMWREWGRSLDLSGATPARRQWADILFLIAVQALPVLILIALAFGRMRVPPPAMLGSVNAVPPRRAPAHVIRAGAFV